MEEDERELVQSIVNLGREICEGRADNDNGDARVTLRILGEFTTQLEDACRVKTLVQVLLELAEKARTDKELRPEILAHFEETLSLSRTA